MKKIRLIFPTIKMEKEALEFKNKFYDNGEKTIFGSYKLDVDKYSYPEWLEIIRNNAHASTANPKFGVSDTLFALNQDDEIVGIINIRYDMTEFYKDSGHIGYSVVPDKRRQGYATKMLKAALEKTKEHNLSEVKVVCHADNIPSKKTIIACEGKLNRVIKTDDIDKEEYIITL
ncbi:MAG: GNAT family N-acetyltransferase [Roseburia sp.]|nr:GNAT family N-acetyltransferase [Roseburia sp.]